MWECLLVVVVVIIFASLGWVNFNLKKQMYMSTEHDADLLRQAAEHSIMASNTVNPLIALLEVCKSVKILEVVNGRYGSILTTDYFMVDTQHVLAVLQDQKSRIIQDLTQTYPDILPIHPLTVQAGFTPDTAPKNQ